MSIIENHTKPNIFICCQKGLGYLTIDTLKGILLELEPNLGDEQLMEIVEEVDEDGSGTIDFDGKLIIKGFRWTYTLPILPYT